MTEMTEHTSRVLSQTMIETMGRRREKEKKETIRARITEREVVGNCTKCCGIGSLRRKHLRREMKGRK